MTEVVACRYGPAGQLRPRASDTPFRTWRIALAPETSDPAHVKCGRTAASQTLPSAVAHVPFSFMSIPPDMVDRHARVLARLTELGLALAEQTFADAEAAGTPAERVEAVKAFHTVSRSVRQCVALEARLARQQAHDAREAERAQAAAPRRKPGGAELSRRISAVREGVTRVIWHEAEDDDTAHWLEELLDEGLAAGCLRDDFCAEALDDHVARLCLELGLSEEAALAWRDLPDPADPDPGDPEADDGDPSDVGATQGAATAPLGPADSS